jgi:hypothetical protein
MSAVLSLGMGNDRGKLFTPDVDFVEARVIFCEQISSRIRYLQRYTAYVAERVEITDWLIRRGRGLPEVAAVEEPGPRDDAPEAVAILARHQ